MTKIDNFEMEILDEGVLNKSLTVPGKTLDRNNPCKTNYDVIK